MKLVLHDNKLYSAVTPSAYMFHSTMIREVYSRGDFLAVDLMTGDMTVLPGRARMIRKFSGNRFTIEQELGTAVSTALERLKEATSDVKVIKKIDDRLAKQLADEREKLEEAGELLEELSALFDARMSATAIACEHVDSLTGDASSRYPSHTSDRIFVARNMLGETAALVSEPSSIEKRTGRSLLKKLEEIADCEIGGVQSADPTPVSPIEDKSAKPVKRRAVRCTTVSTETEADKVKPKTTRARKNAAVPK